MNLQNIWRKFSPVFGQKKDKAKSVGILFSDLTPTTVCDDKDVYCRALEWALQNPQVRNIALSGPYGSGKSSVLRKFREKRPGFKKYCIDISLASLSQATRKDAPEGIQNSLNPELIEMSILQQIFYRERTRRIPDSRFKRIRRLTSKSLVGQALGLVCLILLGLFPVYLSEIMPNIEPASKTYIMRGWLVVLALVSAHFMAQLLRAINGSKLNKLNLKNAEIELSKNTEPSILNKYLDEILYFFEATKYNVVILEDLDRFDDPGLFIKLREINLLLNNSQSVGRRIVFIYAVRDDLFLDKNRTKFFDFIIPVIPVINPTNASDVFTRMLSGTKVSPQLLDDISLYIDDMRLLKNICNEYFVYKENLNEALNQDKIFALIVYKNLFPEDFVALHVRQGMVAQAFGRKQELAQRHIAWIEKQLPELEQKRRELFAGLQVSDEINREIEQLKNEKVQTPSWSLQQLLEKNQDIRLFEKKKEEIPNADLIVYLLRYGYIAEDYQYYISLFHEGRLTQADYSYLLSVKNRRALPFDYPLGRIDNLLSRLRPIEFSYKAILNDSLTDYLLKKYSTEDERVRLYFEQLSNASGTSLKYIDHYLADGSQKPKFVARLAEAWPQWWDFATEHAEQYSEQTLESWFRLLLQHAEINDLIIQDTNLNICQYILARRDFLTWATTVNNDEKIKQVISRLDIRFTALDVPQEVSPLLDYIYENGCYELTPEMIALFVWTKGKDVRVEDLETANYSTILSSGCEPLIHRIEENIQTYIDQVFLLLETNTQETQEAVVQLLNNPALTGAHKTAIIRKETIQLEDITAISHQALWPELLRENRMQLAWENVVAYYEYTKNEIDDDLIEFLNRPENYTELSKVKFDSEVEMTEEVEESLSLAILRNDALALESYTALLKSIPLSCSQWDEIDIEDLSEQKVDVLIAEGFLALTTENYDSLKAHFAPKHITWLEAHAVQCDSFIGLFEFDNADVHALLESVVFSLTQKVVLIHMVNENLIIEQDETCALAGRLLYEAQDQAKFSFSLLEHLVRHASEPEQKVRLMLWHWDAVQDEEQITSLLQACGSPYGKLTQNGKRPALQQTSYNYSLAEKLTTVDYISSYSEEKNIIRINTKQR
ncbi:MAG: hypothetical protein J1F42_12450 [Lachnospiraceae bacterium]|nr:hypothetical protein [Lachnospiraceae bacterium]